MSDKINQEIEQAVKLERSGEVLREKLNQETAKIGWPAVERLFANGQVIWVEKPLDLIDVALQVAENNQIQIEKWLNKKNIYPLTDNLAQTWHSEQDEKWALVVKPWVLVQNL